MGKVVHENESRESSLANDGLRVLLLVGTDREGTDRRSYVRNRSSILDGYRDQQLARKLRTMINDLAKEIGDYILLMHVCGSHEWTITHYGIRDLLPENVELRAGPGCPVCITPAADIDSAVELAVNGKVILTYGDMARAAGSRGLSLSDARSLGADVRIVYGVHDATLIAGKELRKEFVFFAVGFDTTAPPTAYEILKGPPRNLSYIISYRYCPTLAGAVLESPIMGIDGLINAGHSATVTGMKPYYPYFLETRKPQVFCGFEPIDVLIGVAMALRQIKENEPRLENEYTRSVTWEGNVMAQKLMDKAFSLTDGYARGIATLPDFGFEIKPDFSQYDAKEKYALGEKPGHEQFVSGARCGEVTLGLIDPPECPLYMKECTRERPRGATMVSVEGTCRIWAEHKILQRMRCPIPSRS